METVVYKLINKKPMKKQIYRIATLFLVLITISSCSGGDDSSNNDTPDPNPVLPTVTIAQITNITSENATSGGQITNDGGATILEKGVCWSTSPNPDITNNKTNEGSGSSDFVSEITNLNSNTEYYVRAYATNSVGTSYSEQSVFNTTACVYEGNVIINTQEGINAFGENNYCEINGNLIIGYTDNGSTDYVIDLSPLSSIKKVKYLSINSSQELETLSGLNIETVSGIIINNNNVLSNIDALLSINSDIEFLSVSLNSELTNINGLSNITTLKEIDQNSVRIEISLNYKLTNIDGLSNISTFEIVDYGGIEIVDNNVLANINGLNNIPSDFKGNIIIDRNQLLNNIEGLSNITNIRGDLSIVALGDDLVLDGLESLTTIDGKLTIAYTKAENLNGLNNLVSVGEEINISSNHSLINIDGLNNLDSANQIIFKNNNTITNIDGFANINSITNDLELTQNNALSDFCGLNEVIFANGIGGNYIVEFNAYNPTQQDILDGNCSL
ncbi:MAG: hypothetical protein COB12_10540 [Flavobacterium sp.]|nr:MAG: hypothetical protein COB12_10540 [Flavobacterium sp.]